MQAVAEIRRFNRFYTHTIGLLNRRLPESDLSLPEARVLFELANSPHDGRTAAGIGRALDMDKAHLSRIISRFKARGYVSGSVNKRHEKHVLLSLTSAGQEAFAALEKGTQAQIQTLVEGIDERSRERLLDAMRVIRNVLDREGGSAHEPRLRGLKPGDLGWIIHRQTVLYNQEYGWDWTYEGLASKILGQFVAEFDANKETAWVAEWRGEVVGSVFLMKGDAPETAKLRLLYVEPSARGKGIGRQLVDACIAHARALGYRKLTLWTNDVLVAARHIYQSAGFHLTDEAKHHSFGRDLVGQTWALDL